MKEYPAWGVDVTAVALRGVKLEKSREGRPRISAWDVVDYTEQVEDVSSLTRIGTMSRGIFHFRRRHDVVHSRIWVSLRSEIAFNRTVVVPPVNDESLDRILMLEAQQQVPFPLDEVYWDRRVIAIRESGEVLATLYAIRKTLVEDRLRKLRKAGLPIDGIQLRPVALQNFCAYERLLENGTIVIDVDYNGLQILVHHDDQTWFRVLPVGAVDFVDVLAKGFLCGHSKAVRMASGDEAPPRKEFFEGSRRKIAQQLADEAQRTVRFYLATRPGVEAKRVVLFESHRCAPSMEAALKDAFGLPVLIPRGFRHIDVDPEVVTAGIQSNFGALAKATGLALQGIGKAECEVRVFPPEVPRKLGVRKTGYYAALVALLALIGIATWRHKEFASDLLVRRDAIKTLIASAPTKASLEEKWKPRNSMPELATLGTIGDSRDQLATTYEQIAAVGASLAKEQQVVVVKISLKRTPDGKSRVGELTLAAPLALVVDKVDASLDQGAARIVEKSGAENLRPLETWTSETPGAAKIESGGADPSRLVRWRFRHRSYSFDFGGGAP